MCNKLSIRDTCSMFIHVCDKVMENEAYLTQLDKKIGDGDHGTVMSIGSTKAKQILESTEFTSINHVFKEIGITLIKFMGGTSGVIFGTLFTGGIRDLEDVEALDLEIMVKISRGALSAIKKRGKAQLGDKTMVDALEPAVVSLEDCLASNLSLHEAIKTGSASAKVGAEKTKEYVSRVGRSKSYGEHSLGLQDAGATSVQIIFEAMEEWLQEKNAVSA